MACGDIDWVIFSTSLKAGVIQIVGKGWPLYHHSYAPDMASDYSLGQVDDSLRAPVGHGHQLLTVIQGFSLMTACYFPPWASSDASAC